MKTETKAMTCSMLALLFASAVWSQTVTIKELPPLPGHAHSAAYAINSLGQAAGESDTDAFIAHAAIWQGDGPHDLQTLATVRESFAFGINDLGQATGDVTTLSGAAQTFYWNGSGMQVIARREGYAINNGGRLVGVGGSTDGFSWAAGVITQLKPLPGHFSARPEAINDMEVIVGTSIGSTGRRVVKWSGDTPEILSGMAGVTGTAYGVNAKGQIVGDYDRSGIAQAFIWNANSGLEDLPLIEGAFTSHAYGVNGAGDVVGDLGGRPTLWKKSDTGYRLIFIDEHLAADSGWSDLDLYGINDSGQIVGTGSFNGSDRGFILTVDDSNPTLEVAFANRDDPFAVWTESWADVPNSSIVYAGDFTGDLIAWRVKNAPTGSSFKWTAVQTVGLKPQTLTGPDGDALNQWSLTSVGLLDWPPGTYRITCVVSSPGKPVVTLVTDQVVGWRGQDYVVVGQVKPILDYNLTGAQRSSLVHALINSYNVPREWYLVHGTIPVLNDLAGDERKNLDVLANPAIFCFRTVEQYQAGLRFAQRCSDRE